MVKLVEEARLCYGRGTRLDAGEARTGGGDPSAGHRPFHLQLDQAVHLDCVLRRELLDNRLHEAVD